MGVSRGCHGCVHNGPSSCPRTLIYLLFVSSLTHQVFPFNLDVNAPIYKFGPENTYFGYSVAQHFRSDLPVILVGAPRGDSGQVGTEQAGTVYSCPLNTVYNQHSTRNDWCEKLKPEYLNGQAYSKSPSLVDEGNRKIHYLGKNNQLLGASVVAEGTRNGSVVVCAPLVRFHNISARVQGACYQLKNNLEFENMMVTCEQKNLETTNRQNSYGACMEGMSAYVDHDMVITGIIGAMMWTGGVYAKTVEHDLYSTPVEKYTMLRGDEIVDEENESYEKAEKGIRPTLQSHAYLGYSVSVGRFGFWYEQSLRRTIVSGATRHNQTGAVAFLPFEKEKKTDTMLTFNEDKFMLHGSTWGSGFGYSLLVIDLNADGFDDLVVGAPFEHRNDKDGQFGGVVYVYFSQGFQREREESHLVFKEPKILKGPGYHSQFGLSLTKLGNVDGDKHGVDDFAVGAPFTDGGFGAVYMYHGSKKIENFRTKPAQIIRSSDLPSISPSREIRSFGFSLSGGSDLDGNGYPDLAVGAFNNSVIAVFRSRPVISIQAGHKTAKPSIDIEKGVNCPRGAHTCFSLDLTLLLDGGVSKSRSLIDFENNVFICNLEVLEAATGVSKRAVIADSSSQFNHSWPCGKGTHRNTQTYTQKIYIPSTGEMSRDWVNPLKFRFTVRIVNERKPEMPVEGGQLVDLNRFPILNKYGSTYEFSIPFNTRCGEDEVCQTDLSLKAVFVDIPKTDKGYVSNVGEKDHLDIKFTVENKKEKAYGASLYLTFDPEELELPHIHGKEKKGLILETIGTNVVHVLLGNPMDSEKKHNFDIRFKLVRGRTEGIGRPLEFNAIVNSTSEEVKEEDNQWQAQVRLIKKAELELIGTSDPPVIRFGGDVKGVSAMDLEEDIGVMVRHNYTVHNKGPWTVRNVVAKFDWPYQISSKFRQGKYGLYLLDVPTITTYNTDGTVDVRRCVVEHKVEHVNPEDIKLNTKYSVQVTQAAPRIHHVVKRYSPSSSDSDASTSSSSSSISSAGLFSDRISPHKKQENGMDVDVVSISCTSHSAKCFSVTCHFDFIDANSAPVIDFRARLWNSTFIEDYSDVEYVELSSWGRLEVDENQGIDDDPSNNAVAATTLAYPDKPSIGDSRPVPWWLFVVAAVVGLLILAVLILLLWKCGFFKRERPNQPSLYQAELRHEREEWAQL